MMENAQKNSECSNIALKSAQIVILQILNSKISYNLTSFPNRSLSYWAGFCIAHVKRSLNVLYRQHKLIDIIPQFCPKSGKQLSNQYSITNKGYLFLSLNEPPLLIKEKRKYFQNSFDIFYFREHFSQEIISTSQKYALYRIDISASTQSFFHANIEKHSDKRFTKKIWFERYTNYMDKALYLSTIKKEITIKEINVEDLINEEDIQKIGLTIKQANEGIEEFKTHHDSEYFLDNEVKKTKIKWRELLIGWLKRRLEMIKVNIKKQIRISTEKYISQFKEVGKEVTEKLGEKKAKICINLFAKYHAGKENTIFVWNKLRDGWIERAIKNIVAKEEKELSDYKDNQEKEIKEIADKSKPEVKIIIDKVLSEKDEKLQSAICRIYTLPCYTPNDRLRKEIGEEILIGMNREKEYDIKILDMINMISMRIPVEGVLGISVDNYYNSSNKIRERELLEMSKKLVEYGIVKRYKFKEIVDRDRGEVIWKKR